MVILLILHPSLHIFYNVCSQQHQQHQQQQYPHFDLYQPSPMAHRSTSAMSRDKASTGSSSGYCSTPYLGETDRNYSGIIIHGNLFSFFCFDQSCLDNDLEINRSGQTAIGSSRTATTGPSSLQDEHLTRPTTARYVTTAGQDQLR